MADTTDKANRSIADEIGDSVFDSVKTPVEIFFFALFVAGVLSLAATTLVGPCGNVDDVRPKPDPRIAEYVPGATVVITGAILFDDLTTVVPGACGIIDSVDEEGGTARVHILAKAEPFFSDSAKPYSPFSVFSGFSQSIISSVYFLHTGNPVDDVPLRQIAPVETQGYSNAARHFYLQAVYFVMIFVALLIAVFTYIGARFMKKRAQWYKWHTLRATYISRLMKDRGRTRELQERWEQIVALSEAGDPASWQEALNMLNETLDGVLTLLRFEGETLTLKLQEMTEKDLWCIERLWKAHSLILQMQGEIPGDISRGGKAVGGVEREGDAEAETGEGEVTTREEFHGEEAAERHTPLPMTEETVKKVVAIHKESFIWLGLLPHWA